MKAINYKIKLVLFILLISFSNYSCSDNGTSSEIPNGIKLVYSTNNGQDIYKKGDYIGEKIIINYDGTLKKYTRYYDSDDVLLQTTKINSIDIQELDNLFNEYNFNNYPNTLPRTNQIHWPASGCSISFSKSKIEQIKEVSIIGFEDSKYYPSGFYPFLEKLKEKLISFIN